MELTNQVVSLDLSRKLKELGVKQESLFYYRLAYSTSESFDNGKSQGKIGEFGNYEIQYYPKPRYTTADIKWNEADLAKLNETELSAFTVAELGTRLWDIFEKHGWNLLYKAYGEVFNYRGTERIGELGIINLMRNPDMGAKMLIYLLENISN